MTYTRSVSDVRLHCVDGDCVGRSVRRAMGLVMTLVELSRLSHIRGGSDNMPMNDATQPAGHPALEPGWYIHPENPGLEIYWNGSGWALDRSGRIRERTARVTRKGSTRPAPKAAVPAATAPAVLPVLPGVTTTMATEQWQMEMLKINRSIKFYVRGLWWVVLISIILSLISLFA